MLSHPSPTIRSLLFPKMSQQHPHVFSHGNWGGGGHLFIRCPSSSLWFRSPFPPKTLVEKGREIQVHMHAFITSEWLHLSLRQGPCRPSTQAKYLLGRAFLWFQCPKWCIASGKTLRIEKNQGYCKIPSWDRKTDPSQLLLKHLVICHNIHFVASYNVTSSP